MAGVPPKAGYPRSFLCGKGFMVQQQNIEVEGEVTECLPNTLFRVKLPNNRIVLCHLSGKMRLHFIRILPGDHVKLEMTPYDATKGRIVYRVK